MDETIYVKDFEGPHHYHLPAFTPPTPPLPTPSTQVSQLVTASVVIVIG